MIAIGTQIPKAIFTEVLIPVGDDEEIGLVGGGVAVVSCGSGAVVRIGTVVCMAVVKS